MLCAVNPSIGGLLIKGEKGTAKSTAARGLSMVMPPIQRVQDSFFNLSETEFLADLNAKPDRPYQLEEIAVPFVDMPVGASEDRVIGSLDIAAFVSEKQKKLLPGLLAGAHRGILYIDEVNLLPDHLVDVLLDVAASGINTVQREGLSVSHSSRFVLIGTMNPEEGNLRPQFLDRFGLMVEVQAQQDISERTEVIKRRIAFENHPDDFIDQWRGAQLAMQKQIVKARQLLSSIEMAEGLLTLISQICVEWSVASLRADIVLYKTAITIAALAERETVNANDIREAAELALIHRKGKKPFDRKQNNPPIGSEITTEKQQSRPENGPKQEQQFEEQESGKSNENECGDESCPEGVEEQVFVPLAIGEMPKVEIDKSIFLPKFNNGKRVKTLDAPKGFQVGTEGFRAGGSLAFPETILHAIERNPEKLEIKNEDLQQKIKSGKTGHLILFVVDASGSMAAGKRMEAVKGSVLALLRDAYQKRDKVGVIAFKGVEATILLEPTRSVDLAEQALETLPTGGRTPLAHALQIALQLFQYQSSEIHPLMVLLSDGKANVPLPGGGDAWQQSLQLANMLSELPIKSLILDTESGYTRLGRASELAKAMKGEYFSIDELSAERITETINSKIHD